jgi:hypothetical protein
MACAQQAFGEGRAHKAEPDDANARTPGPRRRRAGQGFGQRIIVAGRGHVLQGDRP